MGTDHLAPSHRPPTTAHIEQFDGSSGCGRVAGGWGISQLLGLIDPQSASSVWRTSNRSHLWWEERSFLRFERFRLALVGLVPGALEGFHRLGICEMLEFREAVPGFLAAYETLAGRELDIAWPAVELILGGYLASPPLSPLRFAACSSAAMAF